MEEKIQERINEISLQLKQIQYIKDYAIFLQLYADLTKILDDFGEIKFRTNNYSECKHTYSLIDNFIGDLKFHQKNIFDDFSSNHPDKISEFNRLYNDIDILKIKCEAMISLCDGIINQSKNNYSDSVHSYQKAIDSFANLYDKTKYSIYLIYSNLTESYKLLSEGFVASNNESFSIATIKIESGINQYEKIINKILPDLKSEGLIEDDIYNFFKEMIEDLELDFKINSLQCQALSDFKNKNLNGIIDKYNKISDISKELINRVPMNFPENYKIKIEADYYMWLSQLYYYKASKSRIDQQWDEALNNYQLQKDNLEISVKKYIESQHPESHAYQELVYNRLPYIDIEISECQQAFQAFEDSKKQVSDNELLQEEVKTLKSRLLDKEIKEKIIKWQKLANFSIILPIIGLLFLLFEFCIFQDWVYNYPYKIKDYINKLTDVSLQQLFFWGTQLICTILIYFPIAKIIFPRLISKEKKKKYIEEIKNNFNKNIVDSSTHQSL